jgi:hypothetical protein
MTIGVAMLAVDVTSVILVASSISQVTTAQQQQPLIIKMKRWSGKGVPQTKGCMRVENETSNLTNENENVNVPFVVTQYYKKKKRVSK